MTDRATEAPSGGLAGGLAGGLLRGVSVVALLAGVGALCGVAWEAWWTPVEGVVFRGDWYLDSQAAGEEFAATASYVWIAGGVGAVVTALLMWAWPGRELMMLVAVCVGALLAGWLMYVVGHALGPDDPRLLAQGAERGTRLPADLRLAGLDHQPRLFHFDTSALTAWPGGALTGFALATLSLRGRRMTRDRSRSDTTHPTGAAGHSTHGGLHT